MKAEIIVKFIVEVPKTTDLRNVVLLGHESNFEFAEYPQHPPIGKVLLFETVASERIVD